MSKEKYTLPQAFMDDPNVALKWKLYAELNGFWLNGRTVYATNEYFSKKLNVSERAVSYALAELESVGLCTRQVTGMKRNILPGGLSKGRSPASGGGEAQLHAEGEAQLQHNSLSNALNITGEANASRERGVRVPDDDHNSLSPLPSKRKTTPEMKAVFEVFTHNPARIVWKTRVHEREAAQVLHDTFGLEEIKVRYRISQKHRDDPVCPKVDSPTDLLEKMPKLETYLKNL